MPTEVGDRRSHLHDGALEEPKRYVKKRQLPSGCLYFLPEWMVGRSYTCSPHSRVLGVKVEHSTITGLVGGIFSLPTLSSALSAHLPE
jgi:hypothetical protein